MIEQISQLSTYLIDLDGVVYRGEQLVPGAKEFITWLNVKHKKYLFLTNNSFASEEQVLAKLTRLGINSDGSHVLGAGQAAVKHIAHHFPGGNVYIVGEQPLFDLVHSNNLHVANESSHKIDVVLVGLDRAFDYKKLNEAILAIRAGAAFIAINRDALLPVAQGFTAGCGAMVGAIAAGSDAEPEVIGKPQPALLQEAMLLLASQPEETVMIGDTISVDIRAGQAAGTRTLLVFSGKDDAASLAKSPITPDYVYENLAALMDKMAATQG